MSTSICMTLQDTNCKCWSSTSVEEPFGRHTTVAERPPAFTRVCSTITVLYQPSGASAKQYIYKALLPVKNAQLTSPLFIAIINDLACVSYKPLTSA